MEGLKDAADDFELVFDYLKVKYDGLVSAADECGNAEKVEEVRSIGAALDEIETTLDFLTW